MNSRLRSCAALSSVLVHPLFSFSSVAFTSVFTALNGGDHIALFVARCFVLWLDQFLCSSVRRFEIDGDLTLSRDNNNFCPVDKLNFLLTVDSTWKTEGFFTHCG
ncbi:hypothetical protein NL108_017708 [Boleophthalmus pectinirostris]|nr:hypothetical protein NL108_017708 [Boleophthalmus pectinirostris]